MAATLLRIPPRIKVLEAVSAVAAGRVEKKGLNRYRVVSSDGSRAYTVYIDLGQRLAYSNDNGTVYRGYIGYPIIAVLMAENILPYNKSIGEALKDVPWRELNEKYKSYTVVEAIVKKLARERGVDTSSIDEYTRSILERLEKLKLKRLDTIPLA